MAKKTLRTVQAVDREIVRLRDAKSEAVRDYREGRTLKSSEEYNARARAIDALISKLEAERALIVASGAGV